MESTSIYAALAAVQSELKAPKGQMNTFGGYRYRSCEDILEAVKPILKAHDLLLTLSDEPKVLEGWHYIEATAKLESLDPGGYPVTVSSNRTSLHRAIHPDLQRMSMQTSSRGVI